MTDKEGIGELTEQRDTSSSVGTVTPLPQPANTATNSVFSRINQILSDDDLTSLPVAKLILDRMHTAEADRNEFKRYVLLFHEADKKVAVLQEKLTRNNVVDIFVGTSLALGGAAAGFAAYVFDKEHSDPGVICMAFAVVLIVGPVLVRAFGMKK